MRKGSYTQTRRKLRWYSLDLIIYYNENGSDYVYFQNVALNSCSITNDGTPGGFTNCFNFPYSCSEPCTVMQDFINGYHPPKGYEHFIIRFWVSEDFENIPVEESRVLTSVSFGIWNRNLCDNPDNNQYYYHTPEGRIYPDDDNNDHNFVITRKGLDTWLVEVINHSCSLTERYCVESSRTGKGKGKHVYSVTYNPLQAETEPISLKIEFTRRR